jgi:hypothetical protein
MLMHKINLNTEKTIYCLTVIISVFFIVSLFSVLTSDTNYINIFFNSDTLYLPSLYKDIFVDRHGLNGWEFNTAPNFFPDMIVYFLLMFLLKSFILSSFVFPLLQYGMILFLVKKLFQLIFPSGAWLFASLANILLLMIFCVTFSSHDFCFTFYMVSNAYHTGAFVMALACLLLFFMYLHSRKKIILLAFPLITGLCIVSDNLFMVLFSLPMVSLLCLYRQPALRNSILRFTVMNISGVIIGMACYALLRQQKIFSIASLHSTFLDMHNMGSSFHLLMKHMWIYLSAWDLRSLILILSLFSLLLLVVLCFDHRTKREEFLYFRAYCVFAVVFTIFVFFAPVLNGSYINWGTLRYNIYVFYFTPVHISMIAAFFFHHSKRKNKLRSILKVILMAGVSVALFFCVKGFSGNGLRSYFSFYPDRAKCMDDFAQRKKLHHGIATYWVAKYVTMFSKYGVKVYPVFDDLSPNLHVTNKWWFYGDDAVFDFIIVNDFPESTLKDERISRNALGCGDSCLDIRCSPEFGFTEDKGFYYRGSLKKNSE